MIVFLASRYDVEAFILASLLLKSGYLNYEKCLFIETETPQKRPPDCLTSIELLHLLRYTHISEEDLLQTNSVFSMGIQYSSPESDLWFGLDRAPNTNEYPKFIAKSKNSAYEEKELNSVNYYLAKNQLSPKLFPDNEFQTPYQAAHGYQIDCFGLSSLILKKTEGKLNYVKANDLKFIKQSGLIFLKDENLGKIECQWILDFSDNPKLKKI